jgi:hypothetical protein
MFGEKLTNGTSRNKKDVFKRKGNKENLKLIQKGDSADRD